MSSVSYRTFTGTAAENYQRHFVPAISTPVSADLLKTVDLQPGERVLDVACGTGLITRLAAEKVGPTGSVTGVDVAPDMIDVAKTIPSPVGSQIDWQVRDATALPLPDESFDAVLCQMGLMFIEDQLAALGEMRRVLASGGRLVVNTPGSIHRAFELMEQAIEAHISSELGGFVRAVFSLHDPDVVASLLRDAGLDEVSSSVSTATFQLPSPAEFLWQYINLTPMGPFVATAPEAAQLAMEQQVVDSWAPYVVDGGTLVDQPMVIATGRK
jgi:ubiquinone/menaquinone biosynthesis C-methylase UbiE